MKIARKAVVAPVLSVGLAVLAAFPALADNSSKASDGLTSPASDNAQRITDLFWIISIPALVVLVLVGGAIIYAAFRFREKDPKFVPRQVGGNNAMELTWTVVPAITLFILFGISLPTMPYLRQSPKPESMHIAVTGHRFVWSFKYPGKQEYYGAPGSPTEDMVIPVGEVVNLDLYSADVIHSWSVPRLGGRMDAIPGQHNFTWVKATAPGLYYGQCTEFCGLSHASMSIRVRVLSRPEFDAWFQKLKKG
ncbi:MAG: cytochrome c oxidase subunit II [Candidatus Dormibacteria bacterium]